MGRQAGQDRLRRSLAPALRAQTHVPFGTRRVRSLVLNGGWGAGTGAGTGDPHAQRSTPGCAHPVGRAGREHWPSANFGACHPSPPPSRARLRARARARTSVGDRVGRGLCNRLPCWLGSGMEAVTRPIGWDGCQVGSGGRSGGRGREAEPRFVSGTQTGAGTGTGDPHAQRSKPGCAHPVERATECTVRVRQPSALSECAGRV